MNYNELSEQNLHCKISQNFESACKLKEKALSGLRSKSYYPVLITMHFYSGRHTLGWSLNIGSAGRGMRVKLKAGYGMTELLMAGCGIRSVAGNGIWSFWQKGCGMVQNCRADAEKPAGACCGDGVPRVTSSFLGRSSPIRRQNFVSPTRFMN